jgi:hypothetical protein
MLVSETDAAFIRGLSAAARGHPIVRPNPDEDDAGGCSRDDPGVVPMIPRSPDA